MRATYSTSASPPAAKKQFWQRAVSETYFPLDLRFQSAIDPIVQTSSVPSKSLAD